MNSFLEANLLEDQLRVGSPPPRSVMVEANDLATGALLLPTLARYSIGTSFLQGRWH